MIRKKKIKDKKHGLKVGEVKQLIGPHDQTAGHTRSKSISKVAVKDIKLSLLCSGQLFGQEDAIKNRNYSTSVRCLSTQGQLFCITSAEFF